MTDLRKLSAGLTALMTLVLAGAALAAATASRNPTPTSAAKAQQPQIRDASLLPTLDRSAETYTQIFPGLPPSDTFLVSSYGFDNLAGACDTRGWLHEDRSQLVFAHNSAAYVVNRAALAGRAPTTQAENFTGLALTSRLNSVRAVAVNDSGRVVYTDVGLSTPVRMFQVYPNGTLRAISTFGPTDDPRFATFDPLTNGILVSMGGRIYQINSGGGAPVLIAGGGGVTQDTTAAEANLGDPAQTAVDALGNIYFADGSTHRVRMIRTDNRVVTIAGNGTPGSSGDSGPATGAQLNGPRGVTLDPTGGFLYIGDEANNRVRKVDLATGIITTEIGPGTPTTLKQPSYLVFSGGALFVRVPGAIFRYVGGVATLVAGGGDLYASPAAATLGAFQRLVSPQGLTSDGTGGVYFADFRLVWHLKADGTLEVVAGDAFGITMGSRALRVGCDITSHPQEVMNWVDQAGYGTGWSQRFVSPPFSSTLHPNAVLTFDCSMEMEFGLGPTNSYQNEYIAVEAQGAEGQWITLSHEVLDPDLGLPQTFGPFDGRGTFKVTASLAGVPFIAPTTRVRVMVQTSTLGSNEEGTASVNNKAAAIIDNVELREGTTDVLPPVDFEDGTLGGWTLSAFNAPYNPGALLLTPWTRDFAPPNTDVQLQQNFDPLDASCAWTFTGTGGYVVDGTYARLTSPWVATGGSGAPLRLTFSGKLNTTFQKRVLNVLVRSKSAGDKHPRASSQHFFLLNGGALGDDNSAPFFNQSVLRYPEDFQTPAPILDSVQVVYQVEDRTETIFGGPTVGLPTRLPYLDDLRIFQVGVDQDFDGVADVADACPTVSGTGQDADGNGCPDPTATLHHVESWGNEDLPIRYRISQDGSPAIPDATDVDAIRIAFDTWKNVPGSNLPLIEEPVTSQADASALDGINLVTFQDPDCVFPSNVLALTPTLSSLRRDAWDDRMVLPGQILDADLILNPNASYKTSTHAGTFDLISVATHEAGHFLGLSHTGVLDATMFYVLQPGQDAASLEDDDRAAIASAYPGVGLGTNFGTIRGVVRRGQTQGPLPGAVVTAVRVSGGGAPQDTAVSDYSAEDGSYALRRLPPGRYAVRITPLDGSLDGLIPRYISNRVLAIAQTNFVPEWWSVPETDRDLPSLLDPIDVAAAATIDSINVITTVDTIPPQVVSVSPADSSTGIGIDAAVVVKFSEAIRADSLGKAFKLRRQGVATTLDGVGQLVNGTDFVFVATDPLKFGSTYELEITTTLVDLEGVHMAANYHSTFETASPPSTVSITSLLPNAASVGTLITINGVGFDAVTPANNSVVFSLTGDAITVGAVAVTPSSIVVRVPSGAVSGPVFVSVSGSDSNPLNFTVLPPAPQASPVQNGQPVPLAFTPSDVALSPDGATAYVVGGGGFVTIDLNAALRAPQSHSATAAQSIALTPDGSRAVLTRPAGEVVVVDAVPSSGSFGQPVGPAIVIAGAPNAVAISPNGKRAYITDKNTAIVREIDLDLSSPALYTVRKEINLTGLALSGGLAVSQTGQELFLTSGNRGLVRVVLGVDSAEVVNSLSTSGGVVQTPDGAEVLAAGTGSSLPFARIPALPGPGPISVFVGGIPRDVAMTREGQSAFAVNSLFNELQVINMDTASPSYHTKVASVTSGTSPVAIAVSSLANIAAVANAGSRDVTIYSVVAQNTFSATRLLPDVVTAGDMVAVQGSSVPAGTQVDLGSGLEPAAHVVPGPTGGVAFAAPISGQASKSVTLQSPSGVRTLALPLQVVDPVGAFLPKDVGYFLDARPSVCPGLPGVNAILLHMRSSMDGRMLAAGWGGTDADFCDNYYVTLHQTSAAGSEIFGKPLASNTTSAVSSNIADLQFQADGKELWIVRELDLIHMDTDPSSVTFGQDLGFVSGYGSGDATALAADPLNRYMFVGTGTGEIAFMTPGATATVSILATGTGGIGNMQASPDGRTLVACHGSQAVFVSIDAQSLVAVSPPRPGLFAQDVCIPGDGKRVLVRYGGSWGMYNLDPAAGPVGAELFFGGMLFPGPVSNERMIPGPDGHSILIGSSGGTLLFRVDLSSTVPFAFSAETGVPTTFLAGSTDGRRVWAAPPNHQTPLTFPLGMIRLLSLSEATQIALVSGADQSAQPGTTLPLPIRVRVTDGQGRPQEGVVVQFGLGDFEGPYAGDNGYLDGIVGRNLLQRITDTNGEIQVSWTMPGVARQVRLAVYAFGLPQPYLFVFATSTASDAEIVPAVLELGPKNGATGINAGSAVYARFNQRMNTSSVSGKMTLTANGSPVQGGFSFQDDGRFVLFQPLQPLAYNAACVLTVQAGALDTDAQALPADVSSSFSIQSPPALKLTALSPLSAPAGSPLVLEGTGFSATPSQNTVLVNGVLATARTATATSITTNVPLAATSGPVTVKVGGNTSDSLNFIVLVPNPTPGGVVADLPASQGIRAVEVTPDGKRAYVTNPSTNSVTVLDIDNTKVLTSITVGLMPQGLGILPDGSRAYVANSGSDDVSVIDTNPASPTYNTVVSTIPVGDEPVGVAVSAVGPKVYVANKGSGDISVIDALSGNATFDQVVSTVSSGAGSTDVEVSSDGTRIYVATAAGVVMVDLTSGVVSTVTSGSSATDVEISSDGAIVLALLANGQLIVIDAVPGSSSYNQVVASVSTGGGSTDVDISSDGALAYVTNSDGNNVQVFRIDRGGSGQGASVTPGPAVTLTLIATIPVGQTPVAITNAPAGNFLLVANSGSGTVTVIGQPSVLPPIPVEFAFTPNTLNLNSMGRWVTGFLEPPDPYLASDFVISSIRINGAVGVDPEAPHALGDHDGDGKADLMVKFLRSAVELVVQEGDQVPVTATGILKTRTFTGTDLIKVKRGKVKAPLANAVIPPGQPYLVEWEAPKNSQPQYVAFLQSFDHGSTWKLVATGLPNTGHYTWSVPDTVVDSVKVALAFVESEDPPGPEVTGVLAVSDYFAIYGPTAVVDVPATLQFAPIQPNPSVGAVRMRFGLPRRADVTLEVFDVQGRRVVTLLQGMQSPGWHQVTWSGRNESGGRLGSGLYFVRFQAEGREFKQRVTWLR